VVRAERIKGNTGMGTDLRKVEPASVSSISKDRPVLSLERAPHTNKTVTVKQ
jgi:hypothetical protein